MWITPYHQDSYFSSPLSIDDKITIVFYRTDGWQLEIADQCINGKDGPDGQQVVRPIQHSGFAALHIVLSYFETIAKYQAGFAGSRKSEHYFREGVYSVLPLLREESSEVADSLLDTLYSEARCGLYHSGISGPRIILTADIQVPMQFEDQTRKLLINPHLLVPELRRHLRGYIEEVREVNNRELRKNFERRFDYNASRG